ncbi:hypothetical protein CR513_52895, partial [Mucuna pruriens]
MIVLLSLEKKSVARTLEGEQWLQKNLVLHSLPRGNVRGSQRNPCSTVPGRSRGRCTLGVVHAPLLLPDIVPNFGEALPPSINANATPQSAYTGSEKHLHRPRSL